MTFGGIVSGHVARRVTLAAFGVCLSITAASAETVTYTSFYDQTYELTAWDGSEVSVLTESPDRDRAAMGDLVGTLDSAWRVYADMTGRRPSPYPPTTRNGLATIAEIPNGETCGAGCGYLGANGIEIASTYFQNLYDGVVSRDEYDQIPFYEMGRNYWFYGSQLGGVADFTVAFAIGNRFVSMEEVGIAGGPFGDLSYEEFRRMATSDVLNAYQADPTLDWRSIFIDGERVPDQRFGAAGDLAGAFYYEIYKDHGIADYGRFYRELSGLGPGPDADAAMTNFLVAAFLGTGKDYRKDFKATDLDSPALPSPVPLPASALLLLAGLAGLSATRGASRGRTG